MFIEKFKLLENLYMSFIKVCTLSAVSILLAETFIQTALAQSISGKIVNTQGEPISGALVELGNNIESIRSNE